MGKKKILILIPSLKLGGGAEKIASTLGSELNLKYDIYYLTFRDVNIKYFFTGKYFSFKEENSLFLFKPIKLFIRAFKIYFFCKKYKFNTIISFMEEANFSLLIAKILNINSKIIISIRKNPNQYVNNLVYKFLIRFLYPKADKIVSLSKGVEFILRNEYNLKNTITIYNLFNFPKKNYLKKKNKNLIFLNVGRLTEVKGQYHLIKAFKLVVNKVSTAKLYIVGEGTLRKEFENLIEELNLKKNIFLLGSLKDVSKYFKKADFFVFTSLYEGFGNVLVEAMFYNLPIISTDCQVGPREIITPELSFKEKIKYPYFGKYGILVEPFSKNFKKTPNLFLNEEKKLAKIMLELIHKKKLKEKYSNSLKRANHFNKYNIIKEWEKIL